MVRRLTDSIRHASLLLNRIFSVSMHAHYCNGDVSQRTGISTKRDGLESSRISWLCPTVVWFQLVIVIFESGTLYMPSGLFQGRHRLSGHMPHNQLPLSKLVCG